MRHGPARLGRGPAVSCARLGIAALLLAAVAPAAGAQDRVAVLEETTSTAVGMAIVLSAGSGWEAEEEAGVTQLAAHALVEELRPQLEVLGARVAVECDRTTVGFTLLVPASTWQVAAGLFLHALFEYRVGDGAVERARTELLRLLAVEEGNPPFEVQHALQRALYGDESRWATASCGRRETLAALTTDAVRRIGETRFDPSRAVAAVAGPVSRRDVQEVFGFPEERALPVILPVPESGWTDGSVQAPGRGREVVARGTVTSWVALAFPFPPGAGRFAGSGLQVDTEALRLVAFQLRELLLPSLVHPDIFDVATDLDRHGGGGVLSITFVTVPGRASTWAERIREAVDALAEEPLPDEAFDALVRRYRGERLLDLAEPEARARDAARQLLFEHRYVPPAERIDSLSPERLRRAAAALGPPAMALLGPDDQVVPPPP